jgi:competence protein ComEC
MPRKYILIFAGFLLVLNFFCWKEVFALAQPRYLLVDFLSVGQGDSAFIQTPEDHQILIDGGPDASVLSKLAYLMPPWDRTIDLIILSHPESDHMQGLLDVLQRYKVGYILWSGVKKTAAEYDAWMNVLAYQKSMGAKIIIAEAGQEISAPGGPASGGKAVLIDILYPLQSLEGKELKNTSNDSCVVSKVIFGKDSFLFTGDISSVAEKELVNAGANLKADILKVAHHGSKYSTSDLFLAAVKPSAAVIEVGKNTYGHPTPEVLQRLANVGARVLRTDQKGDITVISNGNNLIIKTQKQ